MITFKNHGYFFARTLKGRVQLEVPEIRDLFVSSSSVIDEIRSFRTDRLGKILARETPVILFNGACVVMHIIPLRSYLESVEYDISAIEDQLRRVSPFGAGGWDGRYNLDGYCTYSYADDTQLSSGYFQFFRNGILEFINARLISQDVSNESTKYIPNKALERRVVITTHDALCLLGAIGARPPCFAMLSLLNTRGMKVYFDGFRYPHEASEIRENNIVIQEVKIDSYDLDLQATARLLKPAFDQIWNASGLPHSYNYNKDGDSLLFE